MKYWIVLIIGVSLLLGACASSDIQLNVTSASKLNMDGVHKNLPLEIKLYQLSNKQPFAEASFQQLWLHDKQTLGKSLLSQSLLIVKPNDKRIITLPRANHAKSLGIAAIYHNPKNKKWKLIAPIPNGLLMIPGSISIVVNQKGLTAQ